MKKFFFVMVFSAISFIGFSQLTVVNNTGFNLNVWYQTTNLPSGCGPVWSSGGDLIGPGTTILPYPDGTTTYRLAAQTLVANPFWMGWSTCEFIRVTEGCPPGFGDFTFIWNGCDYLEIWP
ncbi:MAG: hypothetical protein ACFB10_08180 [Salibacteraceae bacterium]